MNMKAFNKDNPQERTAMSDELSREQVEKILCRFGIDLRAEWRDDWRALASTDASLRTRLAEQTCQRQQDALDGQAALDLLSQQVADLTAKLTNTEQAYQDKAKLWIEQTGVVADLITAQLVAVERETWEQAAKLGQEMIDAYPADVFIEPPKGQHGETIDACSARAGRHLGKLFRDRCREQGASSTVTDNTNEAPGID